MPGFSANIINLITDNLRDRYQSGFPILKELIQNADDAHAKRFVFGEHPGFKESGHPLLSGPGLFFFNDGEFRESDKKAISAFAENTKAGEDGTIGKFGLGMKSVFHLCEAFFYMAWDENHRISEILNPWNTLEGNLHPSWEQIDNDDWLRLGKIAEDIVNKDSSWFFLWIPLRKKSHLITEQGEESGAIIARFPGDKEETDEDLSFLQEASIKNQLASILPLLPHLESIEYCSNSNDYSFLVILSADERLRRDLPVGTSTGKVIMTGEDNPIYFHGSKSEATENVTFCEFRKHPKWPKTFYRDDQGHPKQASDKSKAEGSVMACHQEQQAGRVSIQWTLFLPLDDENHIFEVPILNSSRHYQFFIHGQFFVDAGRRGIHHFRHLHEQPNWNMASLDDTSLRRSWNQELSSQVSLPLFLPTLAEYVHEYDFGDEEIKLLTKGIEEAITQDGEGGSGHSFLGLFKRSICAKHSWVRALELDRQVWRLVASNESTRMLELPAPPKGIPDRPWSVFPQLGSLDGPPVFIDYDAPKVALKKDQWTESDIHKVIIEDLYQLLTSAPKIDYLLRFIDIAARPYIHTERFQKTLVNILQRCFRTTALSEIRKNRQKFSRVVGHVETNRRLSIGTVPGEVFSELCNAKSESLIVPKDLDSEEFPGKAVPQLNDVPLWLNSLHTRIDATQISDEMSKSCLDVANQLLDKLNESDRLRLLRANPKLKILSVYDARTNKRMAVSFSMLETAQKRCNLFGLVQGVTNQQRSGLASLLTSVIPEEKLFLINVEKFRGLFERQDNLSSAGDGVAILRSLGTIKKDLGTLDARCRLVECVDNPRDDYLARRGLRYLLHGEQEQFTNDEDPLWVSRHNKSLVWEKLWRQITGIKGREAWNVLSKNLVENMPPTRWDLLGIREIEPTQVEDELLRKDTISIETDDFSDNDCNKILAFIDNIDLWRKLPFHTYSNGERGRIGECCYLDVGIGLPSGLSSRITIIRPSEDSRVAQKQKERISRLNEAAIIQIALKDETPGHWWKEIANLLSGKLDAELLEILRNTKWLPLRNGYFIQPIDIINLQELAHKIELLSARVDYIYASTSDLAESLQEHLAFDFLKAHCFTGVDDALPKLGLLMSELPEYRVGHIEIPTERDFCEVLPFLSCLSMLPAWAIMEKVVEEFQSEICFSQLLPELLQPIDTDRLVDILNALSEFPQDKHSKTFNLYLKLFSKEVGVAQKYLSAINLCSQSGEWKQSSELCHGATDISYDLLLNRSQAEILSEIIVDTGRYCSPMIGGLKIDDFDLALQAAPQIIEEYFNKWKGLLPEELIGAFLCFLGPSYRSLADHFLGGHTYEWLIDQVLWRSPQIINPDGKEEWMPDHPAGQILESIKVAVRAIDENQVRVYNLLGDPLKANLVNDFDTIIAGAPSIEGKYDIYLPIRKFDPSKYEPEKLSSFIKNSIRYILDKCYFQKNADLEPLWKELEKSDQLEIEITRKKILNHLPFYLRQLNAHHNSTQLHKALDSYDSALQSLEEYKLSPSQFAKDKLSKLTASLDRQRERLANLFADDESAQAAVLSALRQKLKDFQYDLHSIPFELFQNADDAVVELGTFEIEGDGTPYVPVAVNKLVVDVEKDTFRFMHWGRMINARGPATTDGESQGFHRDLEKMLVLSSSDKPINEAVTGKFGLGFKSVLLCCDNPSIISGQLRVEIIGGVLPRLWTNAQISISKLAEFSEDRRYKGTLTELRLSESSLKEDLLKRFSQLANLLCVFGRAVRRIEIVRSSEVMKFSWTPVCLNETIEVGACEIKLSPESICEKGMVFRLLDGTVFIPITPTGFTTMPAEIPSIWVTAPTREPESLGFAISAPFALDAGRGRLAGETTFNIDLAHRIGKQLGSSLLKLKMILLEDWPSLKKQMDIAENISIAEFWGSLFRTLSKAALSYEGEGAGQVCRELSIEAFRELCTAELPNGLPTPYERLVPVNIQRYQLSGPWKRREVIGWLFSSQSNISSDQYLTDEIASLLKTLSRSHAIKRIDFAYLIQAFVEKRCNIEDAKNYENLALMVWDDLPEQERNHAIEVMAELCFKNKKGRWEASKNLLCEGIGDKEEELRVSFAPDDALLDEGYNESGQSFFKRCRPRYEAPTEILAEWITRADTSSKQESALRYLVNGELGTKVCRMLRHNGLIGTWLAGMSENSPYLSEWNTVDSLELIRILAQNVVVGFDPTVPDVDLDPFVRGDEALCRIYEWWECGGRNCHLEKYLRKFYPQGLVPQLSLNEYGCFDRSAWMTIMSIGVFQSRGRITDYQNRSFIEQLQRNGWWRVFSEVDPIKEPTEWMNVLLEYAEGQVEDEQFSAWMDAFPRIFRISRWLAEYVEIFMSLNRRGQDGLVQLLTPMTDSLLQGGGVSAPPINRTLRMGKHIVIRELLRQKIVTNSVAAHYAYMPSQSVIQLLEDLGIEGCEEGRDIYKSLVDSLGKEKAIFGGDYDIPLRILVKNREIAWDILRVSVDDDLSSTDILDKVNEND